MALVPCPECDAQVSSLAASCPRCGCPQSEIAKATNNASQSVEPPRPTADAGGRTHGVVLRPVPSPVVAEIPEGWTETTDPEVIRRVLAGTLWGQVREGICFVPPEGTGPSSIDPDYAWLVPVARCPDLTRAIVCGEVPGQWGKWTGGFSPMCGWFITSASLHFLYCQPGLGKSAVVPSPRRGSWFAALLPGIWHLVYWTATGIWVGITGIAGGFILTLLLANSIGRNEDGWSEWGADSQVLFILRIVLALLVAWTYFRKANSWRIIGLEHRGFTVKAAIEARSIDDARVKFAAIAPSA